MSRILKLQSLQAVGQERAGVQDGEEFGSTCSYLFCGNNSTGSCDACCYVTTMDM